MEAEVSEAVPVLAPDGFEDFYRRWYPRVSRAVALLVQDLDDGQELAQIGFVRLWHAWDDMASPDHARNFVFKVALNQARSHLRRRRLLRLLGGHPRTQGVAPDAAAAVTDRMAVFEALASLSARQRECVVLVDYLGHDAGSAGRVLGIRPSTVRVQLMRGRAKLRERLEEPS
jgi:RNA polymerase sigma factor (sigma-70 family)